MVWGILRWLMVTVIGEFASIPMVGGREYTTEWGDDSGLLIVHS